jgi:hypothetical protein
MFLPFAESQAKIAGRFRRAPSILELHNEACRQLRMYARLFLQRKRKFVNEAVNRRGDQ